ncbi:hypothetical protein SAMN05216466_10781 [Paraburkholderia phenazinium]|uniref:Uncharacterized protein n=1 Tax=Paraburkholderia phenazinium TaxID=60549 RepID=A0A1G7ZN61_9BURK|nr:hypothetical protein [Paraburkholderia phenazinium]SDH09540.1 hypothetical protein SAMN05216466_10781 [Paraburkholderia phenazinium]
MSFANPTHPNVSDFAAFVLDQGVPPADLPSGTLSTIGIDVSGNLTATGTTGTIAVGSALVGPGIPANTYLVTWNGGTNSGTVSPAPPEAINAASALTLSPYLQWAFNIAIGVTLIPPATLPAILYVMAVYNFGMHQLLKIGQDQPGQTFFTAQRAAFKLLSFIAGPVAASADQSTSNTLVTADFLKGLTMSGLDLIKTPWGQEYLAYSQMYGPNIVEAS